MKVLRNYIDKIKPNFEKGGKLAKFNSFFDAIETLFYVPNKVTGHGAHIRDSNNMKRAMMIVIIGMVPALLFRIYNCLK